jgi:drug/metabolite transporter (DMT)-like permease
MGNKNYSAVAALIASGVAWGTSVPLSKVALGWLAPGWLTVVRFGLAAVVLLIIAARSGTLRGSLALPVLASGAIGYGCSVAVQNVGVARTSVTHAALIIGGTPILVAVIAALWHHAIARPVAWAGFTLSLGGVALIAGSHGNGATPAGDLLVLVAVLVSASVTVAQGRLLKGRDPIALTAVQFLGATIVALPFAATEGLPAAHPRTGAVAAALGLTVVGTLIPFSLFAFGQKRVPAEVAGAFLNLEPLIGAVLGIIAFGDPAGLRQLGGGTAIVAGIALSSLPLLALRPRAITPSSAPAPAAERAAPAGRALAVTAARRQAVAAERPLTETAVSAGAMVVRLQRLRPGPPPLAAATLLAGHAPCADTAPVEETLPRAA